MSNSGPALPGCRGFPVQCILSEWKEDHPQPWRSVIDFPVTEVMGYDGTPQLPICHRKIRGWCEDSDHCSCWPWRSHREALTASHNLQWLRVIWLRLWQRDGTVSHCLHLPRTRHRMYREHRWHLQMFSGNVPCEIWAPDDAEGNSLLPEAQLASAPASNRRETNKQNRTC